MKNKFIPYLKLSKKQKRAIDLSKRRSWNGVKPVTRRSVDFREYNRAKLKNQKNTEA